ncbi:MAG: hypothetical protein HYR64_03710 [Fimbriimonas ginsengisoli]|uniref:Uncharacterized protein n=1 Tax=Fimbriimonas ginsengisoli TaxID=1005039 RepID=A0A931PVE7_FIMGI|nr:hypothetical protein [Fimbriimonas ginsengisoli]
MTHSSKKALTKRQANLIVALKLFFAIADLAFGVWLGVVLAPDIGIGAAAVIALIVTAVILSGDWFTTIRALDRWNP